MQSLSLVCSSHCIDIYFKMCEFQMVPCRFDPEFLPLERCRFGANSYGSGADLVQISRGRSHGVVQIWCEFLWTWCGCGADLVRITRDVVQIWCGLLKWGGFPFDFHSISISFYSIPMVVRGGLHFYTYGHPFIIGRGSRTKRASAGGHAYAINKFHYRDIPRREIQNFF